MDKEAKYYKTLPDNKVECLLCPVNCKIASGKYGVCMSRMNANGKMNAVNYAEIVSLACDPIEKKPLYHFHPGEPILSVAANGCNLHCQFCQNWSISQEEVPTANLSPIELLNKCKNTTTIGVAYTYSEPLVWYEYLWDAMPLVKEAGFLNVLVSNGYINENPLEQIIPFIDAINVDLKGMNDNFYKEVCKVASVNPVLRNIERLASEKHIMLEITNLLIPGLNDSEDDIKKLIDFISGISIDIPLHFSAYHPSYKMDIPATKPETMKRAYNMAKDVLNYVYLGNVNIENSSDTYCPSCKEKLIERNFYSTNLLNLDGSKCSKCGKEINIKR